MTVTKAIKAFYLLGLGALFAMVTSCKEAGFVKGNLENIEDGVIYLQVLNDDLVWVRADTAEVVNGEFCFPAKDSLDVECLMLLTPQQQRINVFVSPYDKLTVTGDINNAESLKIEGSETHKLYEDFLNNVPQVETLRNLAQEFNTVVGDIDRQSELKEQIKACQMEQLEYIKKKIEDNLQNPIAPFILINSLNYYSFEEVEELVKRMNDLQPNYRYVKLLNNLLDNRRVEYEAEKNVAIGQYAPDFTLPDADGNGVHLEDLLDKDVLLSFWASWCGESCELNNKSLVELEQKFGDHVRVVSISVDDENGYETWKQMVKERKIPGVQLIDKNRTVVATYVVTNLPYCVLINRDGVIVAKDTPGTSIFEDIESLLNLK